VAVKRSPSEPDELRPELLEYIASRFKVLSDPRRLKILHTLEAGERSVTELVEATGSTQANVSKHLGILTRAAMVGRRKKGLNVYYSITDPVIFELCKLVCETMRPKLRPR
jgi:DNA-binding transcriptional ArsR family regulator